LPQAFSMDTPRNVRNEERKSRPDKPIKLNCIGEWMAGDESRHYVITLAEDFRIRGEIALAILPNGTPESVLQLTQNKENLSG
jgi:hypothetical protein